MIKTNGFIFAVTTALLINSAYAETVENEKQGWLGKVGTLGAGIDLTYSVNEKTNARFNINNGKIDFDFEESNIDYDGSFNASTAGGLIDYYPHTNDFRLTTGFYVNQNELNLSATGGATSTIGDNNTPINGLQLDLDVGFKKVVPYLGLGWGNAIKAEDDWQFGLDVGVLYQGSAKSSLAFVENGLYYATLTEDQKNELQEALTQEENNINDELKDFKLYPVISVGVGYRF
jgi:hypothetical protein